MKITTRRLKQIIKEELIKLNETRPRHGIDPKDFGRKVVHLNDGRKGIVLAVTKDTLVLHSDDRVITVIPSQVDWPRTTGSKRA
tara:strand:+ start:732 stop:983 length:252 start_codon:yes stop_codon:yes gene_type:complete